MENPKYDVIAVGSGPGGSVAASIAARNGLKTLLVDREQFPREKACGDAVPTSAFELMEQIGLKDTFHSAGFLDIEKVKIIGPKGASMTLKFTPNQGMGTRVVSRYVFDQILHQHAIDSGADFCELNVIAPLIEEGVVVGITCKLGSKTTNYRSKVVIAADGATSTIARGLNVPFRADKDKAVALRGYIETDIDLEPIVDFSFFEAIQPGYAWFFPTGKRQANIGVGMRADFYKKKGITLPNALQMYMQSEFIRDRVGSHLVNDVKSWQLPLCSTQQKNVFSGAILIGDAGGFVNPLTGAGIYQAMITGKYAADTATNAIRVNDVSEKQLHPFETLCRRELGWEMKRSTYVQQVISHFPSLMDAILLTSRLTPGLARYIIGKV